MLAGDVLDPQKVRRVLNQGPPGQLSNAYGPTESTTYATCYNKKKSGPIDHLGAHRDTHCPYTGPGPGPPFAAGATGSKGRTVFGWFGVGTVLLPPACLDGGKIYSPPLCLGAG